MKVNDKLNFCEECQFGKLHSLPFPISSTRIVAPFKLIHTDLWGPLQLLQKKAIGYYVHFLDNLAVSLGYIC